MTGSLPTVTVVIPAYNAVATLGRALDSVLAQTGCELDVVVVNDGSTDATAALLDRYSGKIRVLTQENRGVAVARNAGIESAVGEFIAFLDSDDEWLHGKLAKQLAIMREQPAVDLVYSGAAFVYPDGRQGMRRSVYVQGRQAISERLARGNIICTSTVLARSRCFQDRSIRFPPHLKLGEDYFVWLSLALSGCAFFAVPEPLVRYTVSGNPRKYALEEHRLYSECLEQAIARAHGLRATQRRRLMRLRRSASSLEIAGFYTRQAAWTHAVIEAVHAWTLDPTNLRGIIRFLWHALARWRRMGTT